MWRQEWVAFLIGSTISAQSFNPMSFGICTAPITCQLGLKAGLKDPVMVLANWAGAWWKTTPCARRSETFEIAAGLEVAEKIPKPSLKLAKWWFYPSALYMFIPYNNIICSKRKTIDWHTLADQNGLRILNWKKWPIGFPTLVLSQIIFPFEDLSLVAVLAADGEPDSLNPFQNGGNIAFLPKKYHVEITHVEVWSLPAVRQHLCS